ncbi:monooxygenase [Spongiactinospora gelatinilytica]|uniref:Monooxygenase n=1 Tax=Spongiactinospora gelatinilytica TaxID=2666298 RepID=A0A2W2FYZ8_9ACTN|nr:FAD-dependent monooxygenase [Spongiactinospora gelatinilytica]PZG40862.1 monooxygenase [Spongiactinospora gelatinilytica]
MRAIVIGGGIGGLTAAVALTRRGWSVTVLEQAPVLEPVGAGIAVSANALYALDSIEAGAAVRRPASIQGDAGIRRRDGRWLTRTSEAMARERYGASIVVLLRATLVGILVDLLPEGALRLGTAVTAVDAGTGTVTTDAGELSADLVVAADGIHSLTRRTLFPAHPGPAYAGVTAWRLVARRPEIEFGATESWGAGLAFGVTPLAGDLVYCYASDTVPAGGASADGEKAELKRLFGDWHDPIPQILRNVEPAAILRHDLYSLDEPLPAFHHGKVALLGDAAHAMTPNLGQGGCQAMEDAIVLAGLADRPGGLAAYTAARRPRTTKIVARSRAIGRLTRLRNPLAVALRDTAMLLGDRFTRSFMLRQLDDVLGWRPPTPPEPERAPQAHDGGPGTTG